MMYYSISHVAQIKSSYFSVLGTPDLPTPKGIGAGNFSTSCVISAGNTRQLPDPLSGFCPKFAQRSHHAPPGKPDYIRDSVPP